MKKREECVVDEDQVHLWEGENKMERESDGMRERKWNMETKNDAPVNVGYFSL